MVYLNFLWSLLKHKWFVILAGLKVKVPLWRLLIHDLSKFSPVEFFAYAHNFFGHHGGTREQQERENESWYYAWLHHENSNKHHWGYWIPRSGGRADVPLPMPEVHVREMVADWMGASKAYTGSWNISMWANKHGPGLALNPITEVRIDDVMRELGYIQTDNCPWSWALL